MLATVFAVVAHLSPPGGNALTENDPYGHDRLASTLAAADLAADAAGQMRTQIRETYIRKFAEATAAVQTVQTSPKGTRSHARALRLLATASPATADSVAPETVPWHQNRHKDMHVAPAKGRNNATKRQAAAAVLKKMGSTLFAKKTVKGPNSNKAKASAAQRRGHPRVMYDVPMARVAKMAVAAVQKESVLRQRAEVAKLAAQEEAVVAEEAAKETAQKEETMVAKAESAAEANAIAEVKGKQARAVQEKEMRAESAAVAAALKQERKEKAALQAVEEGKAEAAQEALAKAQAVADTVARKRIRELGRRKQKGQRKAMETKAIRAMEMAIKEPIRAEKIEAERERRAEDKARVKATAKKIAKEKRKTNELRVSLEEAQMMIQAKEQEEAAKKVAEGTAKKTAQGLRTAQQDRTQLRETMSVIPQAAAGVSGCRSLAADQALDKWCNNNCQVGFCPAQTCTCASKSKAKNKRQMR